MKPLFAALGAVLLFMMGGVYYSFFYPPSVMKRNTEKALQLFADAVDTQDRARVSQALTQLLADDAKIHLDVTFSAISSANLRPMSQDFDKTSFITFVDNILYSLTDYHYRPTLTEFTLGENDKAIVAVHSGQWADGPSYYTGVSVAMRFSGDAECTGEAVFADKQPKLHTMECTVLLRSVTKTDSVGDTLQKAGELREKLNQQLQP